MCYQWIVAYLQLRFIVQYKPPPIFWQHQFTFVLNLTEEMSLLE